jgi:predicted acylesterase/phospholipase RssA
MSAAAPPPHQLCDIVMKGGITSGVVYPGAVLALKDQYRFKSIGGTSAGGIAAAVVAAAEHNREGGGFRELEHVRDLLQSKDDYLLDLFKPDPPTRRLLAVLVGGQTRGLKGALRAAVRAFWLFPLIAAIVLVAGVAAAVAGGGVGWAVAGLLAAVLILLVGWAASLLRAVLALPANDFGLARLGPQAVGSEDGPALTAWLHDRVQAAAGRTGGAPLTFGDLWGAPAPQAGATPEQERERFETLLDLSRSPEKRRVDLQMMTTNLTYARPMRLPVPFQQHEEIPEEGGELLFEPSELARFFPPDVVAHLERFGAEVSAATAQHLEREAPGRRFRHFPVGPDLPVLVATRMTLSYPVLISAVPLWQLDFQHDHDTPPLRRVVFSDGGITSNFPVHFFDAPLPRRPTFGLDLTVFEAGEAPDPRNPSAAIRRPDEVNGTAYEIAADIDGLPAFAGAILNSLQNWRDNAQARLPGFRERIVHVKMAKGEGGKNLTMTAGKVRELDERGAAAGRSLADHIAGSATGDEDLWNDHRYVRWRSTMGALERLLRSFRRGYEQPPEPGTTPYPERIAEGGTRPPYQLRTAAVREAAEAMTGAYADLGDPERVSLDEGVPRPPWAFRAVPPV